MIDISTTITNLRNKNNMTQNDLAEALHVTRQAVSNWETGKTRPDIDNLQSMADLFEMDVTELMFPTPKKKNYLSLLLRIVIFGALAYIGLLSEVKWLPAAKVIYGPYENYFLIMFSLRFMFTWLTAFIFPCILSVINLFADFSVKNAKSKKNILLAGLIVIGVLVLLYVMHGLWAGGILSFGTTINYFFAKTSANFLPVSSVAFTILYIGIFSET